MEEIVRSITLDKLSSLLQEVSAALKDDKNSSDIESEVYTHLLGKIGQNVVHRENKIQQDYNVWELERTIFYALIHFLEHTPFAKEQPLWRKILLCSEKAFPFGVINNALRQIQKTDGIMYKVPSPKMTTHISRLALSDMSLPLAFIKSLSEFKMLRALKLRKITVGKTLLCNVAGALGESLPENLELLDLSRNLLGVHCVAYDGSETAKELKSLFSRIWALKHLAKLNLSNNLINNSFFMAFCLYTGEGQVNQKNTTLRVLKLCANTLSSHCMLDKEISSADHPLWPLYQPQDCPQNIFPPFFEKFENAKVDIAFNFMMHVDEDLAEAKKAGADVLVIHQSTPYVESVLLPDYVLSTDKPLAVITQKDNHAFIFTEQLEENYCQIKIFKINPMGNKGTKKIVGDSDIGVWRFIHCVREYIVKEHEKYSFSREVIRTTKAVNELPVKARVSRNFSLCALGSAESCYTNSVRLFNSTKALSKDIKKKSGFPCFNMVRDRKGSVNRYYFFSEKVQEGSGVSPTGAQTSNSPSRSQ